MFSKANIKKKKQVLPVPTVSYITSDLKKDDDPIDPFAQESMDNKQ